MKVLYITTMYPIPEFPQQGIFFFFLVKALKKLGVDVTVAVPIPFYDKHVKKNKWTYEEIEINYIRFFKMPGTWDFHQTGKALYRSLAARLELKKFDLYHADAALPSGYAAMLASEKFKKPFVVHGHGLDVFLDESYAGSKNCIKIANNCQLVYEKADAIAGVSRKVLEHIQKRVDITGKGYVVYNGVDTERFHPISRKESNQVIITSIGNLIPLKGHDYTLKAIKMLIDQRYTNIRFKLVGRGYLEDELKAFIKELDIEEYVDFMGYISYDEVVKLLQESDIFVLPSWYEALGCVYLEAMACGVPVIGCYGSGIDEVITNRKDGFLIEGKNLKQLHFTLEELMDQKKRNMMQKYARETVEHKYTWINSAKSMLTVYQKMVVVEH